MITITQHDYIETNAGSFSEIVVFFDELNVVLKVIKCLESGNVNIHAFGGTIDHQEAAKRRYRDGERRKIAGAT